MPTVCYCCLIFLPKTSSTVKKTNDGSGHQYPDSDFRTSDFSFLHSAVLAGRKIALIFSGELLHIQLVEIYYEEVVLKFTGLFFCTYQVINTLVWSSLYWYDVLHLLIFSLHYWYGVYFYSFGTVESFMYLWGKSYFITL